MLARAHAKAQRAGLDIAFDEGLSTSLPHADGRFDRVLSSLFFHHLDRDAKRRTFAQAFRVLKPGGELHVADWGRAANQLMRAAYFMSVEETGTFPTVWGTMSLYRAAKPG